MTLLQSETPEQTITISMDKYLMLLNDSSFLECLKECGVDTFPEWDKAHDMVFGE